MNNNNEEEALVHAVEEALRGTFELWSSGGACDWHNSARWLIAVVRTRGAAPAPDFVDAVDFAALALRVEKLEKSAGIFRHYANLHTPLK